MGLIHGFKDWLSESTQTWPIMMCVTLRFTYLTESLMFTGISHILLFEKGVKGLYNKVLMWVLEIKAASLSSSNDTKVEASGHKWWTSNPNVAPFIRTEMMNLKSKLSYLRHHWNSLETITRKLLSFFRFLNLLFTFYVIPWVLQLDFTTGSKTFLWSGKHLPFNGQPSSSDQLKPPLQ